MDRITEALFANRLLRSSVTLPFLLVGGLGIADLFWNAFVHLQWAPPTAIFAAPAYICFALFVICKIAWPNEIALELFLYLGLWTLFPIFGSHLSYLAATLDLPLQDKLFARADASLGFDWLSWFNFVWAHPQVSKVLTFVYESYLIQPAVLVAFFAFARSQGRNREFIVATIIAMLAVIAISAILPAYGPPLANGIPIGWDEPLSALRQGNHVAPLGYIGIVTFPSFHAALAVIFTLSLRGHLLLLMPAALLNGLMFMSTAPLGGHYLVDLLAGCLIAIGAHFAARTQSLRGGAK